MTLYGHKDCATFFVYLGQNSIKFGFNFNESKRLECNITEKKKNTQNCSVGYEIGRGKLKASRIALPCTYLRETASYTRFNVAAPKRRDFSKLSRNLKHT